MVLGKPTLRASFVNRVLLAYHSPAVGTGQALYDLSVRYGVDDAYALAFFMHESTFGTTGVARATRSLGNIRCTPGYQCTLGYRAYATFQAGYEDWYQLIKDGYVGGQVSSRCPCVTVEQIIPVYAPQADPHRCWRGPRRGSAYAFEGVEHRTSGRCRYSPRK